MTMQKKYIYIVVVYRLSYVCVRVCVSNFSCVFRVSLFEYSLILSNVFIGRDKAKERKEEEERRRSISNVKSS